MRPIREGVRGILLVCLSVFLWTAALAQPRFGGPAPLPGCRITPRSECYGQVWVQGVQAGLQTACQRIAEGHLGPSGGTALCGQAASTLTSCSLASPIVPPNWVGATVAGITVKASGRVIEPFDYGPPVGRVYHTWEGDWAGLTCVCGGDSMLTSDGTCACPAGMNWDDTQQRCRPRPPDPTVIQLNGASRTRALPAGPALPFVASVTRGGLPVPGAQVRIQQDGQQALDGVTDGAGGFSFNYVPPLQMGGKAWLVASCAGCSNEASREITVESSEMCGDTFGNPLQPATGAKLQDEADWLDASPHPLDFVRHWRRGNVASRLGLNWSHGYAGRIAFDTDGARVVLGDGTTSRFAAGPAGWSSEEGDDRLAPEGADWLYTRSSDGSTFRFGAGGTLDSVTQRNGWRMVLTYDAAGALQRVTNAFGRQLGFSYDAAGRLSAVTSPDGRVTAYAYGGNGLLAQVTFPDGTRRSYHYEDTRWPEALSGITDESGQREGRYAYDAEGRAVSTQREGGVDAYAVRYTEVPPFSNTLVAGRRVPESLYRVSADITEPSGRTVTHTWAGGNGRIQRLGASAPYGGTSIAQRSSGPEGLVEAETDFLGVSTFFTWDPVRRLPLGTVRAAGLAEAQALQVQWHPQWRLPVQVTQQGRRTSYTHDAAGNLTSETVTDTVTGQIRTRSWTWNAQGLPETYTDARGATWRQEHDALGRTTSLIDPAGGVTSFTFDEAGRVLTRRDPGGLVTRFAWDPRDRLLSQSAAGEVTAFAWTPTGRLASVTRPDGSSLKFRYDTAQRLVGLADSRGAQVERTLDAAGRVVREEVRDSGGNLVRTVTQGFDASGPVAAVQSARGDTSRFGYDPNGRLTSATDPFGLATRWTLDALGRPVATTFPDDAGATQAWNPLDQVTAVTDPRGVPTTYSRNAFGEVMAESSPDIGTVRYDRDAGGAVVRAEDAKGQVTSFERDAAGRVTRIRHADGSLSVFSHDAAGEWVAMDDPSGQVTLERDALGRVQRKIQWVNDDAAWPSRFEVGYLWRQGALATLTYPSGMKVGYLREAGRIIGIDVQLPGRRKESRPFVTDLAHDALGRPLRWRWASGDRADRTFDTDARMTATEFARYGYDAAGRMDSVSQDLWVQEGAGTLSTTTLAWQAGYDSRNRLMRFTRYGHDVSFGYDANGNRLTSQETVVRDSDIDGEYEPEDFRLATARAMDIEASSNRLLGFTQTLTRVQAGRPDRSTTASLRYTLDANGALSSDGLREFEHDATGRLARVRSFQRGEPVSVRYLHNALGQRVFQGEPQPDRVAPDEATWGSGFLRFLQRTFGWMFSPVSASTRVGTAYVFGDAPLPPWALLGEYDNGSSGGRGRTEYLWLPTEDGAAIPIGMVRNGRLFAIHTDHLGTPRLVTDDEARPVWQWPYSAFGDNRPTGPLRPTTQPANALTNQPRLLRATTPIEFNLRMPGQYWDANAGMSYNYWRSYMPHHGRYAQADPVGLSGGLNRFSYVSGSPLSGIDPDGLLEVARSQNNVSFFSYPGPPAGGIEHAREGPGVAYHMHLRDNEGREARISTETWKPLTPADERIFRSSPNMQKACNELSDGEKKFLDRVNREVFHRGAPTDRQFMRLIQMRLGGRAGMGRGVE